jgi:hypothetical protein
MGRLKKSTPLNNFCSIFLTVLILVLAGAIPSWAANNGVGGTQCAAYNNNQANELERSHVRLLNPSSNTRDLWVICTPQIDSSQATTGMNGYAIGFFENGTEGDINCVMRGFDYYTEHIPSQNPDAANTYYTEAFTITNPGTAPGTAGINVYPTVDTFNDSTTIITYACLLPPGTGINLFGLFP